MSRGERLADPGSLRRMERVAAGWTVAAALGYGLARSWPGAAVLTAASAASIVGFRGLQRIVSALGPPGNGSNGPPADVDTDPAPTEEPAGPHPASADAGVGERAGTIGWRPGLGALVRFGLLGAIAGGAALLLDPEYFPAVVLGFSTLPAAFMTEGALQAARALRGKDPDDFS